MNNLVDVVLEWDVDQNGVVIIADDEVVMSLSLADILQACGGKCVVRALAEIETRQGGSVLDEDVAESDNQKETFQ